MSLSFAQVHLDLHIYPQKSKHKHTGYDVQTLRIATNFLSTAPNPQSVIKNAPVIERIALGNGLSFLNLGTTSDPEFLKNHYISTLASSLSHTSFTISWDINWKIHEARLLAEEIFEMAQATSGSANFRFAVAFNCKPGSIPYFPAAAASSESFGFALGMENSSLLYHAIESSSSSPHTTTIDSNISNVFQSALQPLESIAIDIESATSIPYIGIDASIAPSLDPPSITDAFDLYRSGDGKFGESGTLAVAEKITAALKALPLRLTGYSGLMLPVCEDKGLAQAAACKEIMIHSLLTYSAVCGIGLDTVPVPCPTNNSSFEERKEMVNRVAGLLLDTASLAFRLDKPLSVRLLPVPGAKGGDVTNFKSQYLIDSAVMDL